jgi:hypothetical protein
MKEAQAIYKASGAEPYKSLGSCFEAGFAGG